MKEIQSFKSTALMDAKLYALVSLISLDETTSQLKKSIKPLEKEFERSQIRYVVRNE